MRSDLKTRPKNFEIKLLRFLQSRRFANWLHSAQHASFFSIAHFFTKHLLCIGLGLWHPLHLPRVNAPHCEQTKPQYASSKPISFSAIGVSFLLYLDSTRCMPESQLRF
jgi:hypothetical protein